MIGSAIFSRCNFAVFSGLLSFFFLFLQGGTCFSQQVDALIDQYLGKSGRENLLNIYCIRYQGRVFTQGMMIPMEIVYDQSGKMYQKLFINGQELVQQAFDGKVVWGLNFMNMKPEIKEVEFAENLQREAIDFPDPFLDYEKKGYTAELLGKERIGERICYKVKLTKTPLLASGKDVDNSCFYYFDAVDMLPVLKEKEEVYGPAKGMVTHTFFGNYEKVENVYFPFIVTEKIKGSNHQQIIYIDRIDINPDINPDEFTIRQP
jgi:hypothetical protein